MGCTYSFVKRIKFAYKFRLYDGSTPVNNSVYEVWCTFLYSFGTRIKYERSPEHSGRAWLLDAGPYHVHPDIRCTVRGGRQVERPPAGLHHENAPLIPAAAHRVYVNVLNVLRKDTVLSDKYLFVIQHNRDVCFRRNNVRTNRHRHSA